MFEFKSVSKKKKFLGALVIVAFVALFANILTKYVMTEGFDLALVIGVILTAIVVVSSLIVARRREK